MDNEKPVEISRRGFIKGLGSGTVGAALISSQLLSSCESKAANPPRIKIKARPPTTELWSKWSGIRDTTQKILNAFVNLGAGQVNWRLNESDTLDKRPVFIDWLATKPFSDKLAQQSGLPPDPPRDWGKYRLGDGIISDVYREALDGIAVQKLVTRNWLQQSDMNNKTAESLKLMSKAGLNFQTFIGIKASQDGKTRLAGVLTVSFERRTRTSEVEKTMRQWAGWDQWSGPEKVSPLIAFITENFDLGGPDPNALKKS